MTELCSPQWNRLIIRFASVAFCVWCSASRLFLFSGMTKGEMTAGEFLIANAWSEEVQTFRRVETFRGYEEADLFCLLDDPWNGSPATNYVGWFYSIWQLSRLCELVDLCQRKSFWHWGFESLLPRLELDPSSSIFISGSLCVRQKPFKSHLPRSTGSAVGTDFRNNVWQQWISKLPRLHLSFNLGHSI